MKISQSIPLENSMITNLSRINNRIYAFDYGTQSFLEIDYQHSILQSHHCQIDRIINCKYVDYYQHTNGANYNNKGYFVVGQKTIQHYSFMDIPYQILTKDKVDYAKQDIVKKKSSILTSNKLSNFTGQLCAYGDNLIFTKHHLNHSKFSLCLSYSGISAPKILKLLDNCPSCIHLNNLNPSIIYSYEGNTLFFPIQNPQKQTLISKKSFVLMDGDNLYCTAKNIVSRLNQIYQLQVIDLKTGKYSYSFKGHHLPKQIQIQSNYIFYLTNHNFYVYDKRKITAENDPLAAVDLQTNYNFNKSYQKIAEGINYRNQGINSRNEGIHSTRKIDNQMHEFRLEPNLNKIYLSSTNQLNVYQFKFH